MPDIDHPDAQGFTLWPTLLHPHSRGEVRLRSADPYDSPIIGTPFLSHVPCARQTMAHPSAYDRLSRLCTGSDEGWFQTALTVDALAARSTKPTPNHPHMIVFRSAVPLRCPRPASNGRDAEKGARTRQGHEVARCCSQLPGLRAGAIGVRDANLSMERSILPIALVLRWGCAASLLDLRPPPHTRLVPKQTFAHIHTRQTCTATISTNAIREYPLPLPSPTASAFGDILLDPSPARALSQSHFALEHTIALIVL